MNQPEPETQYIENTPRRAVIVVGAGAGGLMAAGRAAESGARVILLERGPQTARKLRIAGKGRANVTNTADKNEFIAAFGENGKFLYGAFSRFFKDDLRDLLRRLGVETKVERGGRVFPVSDDADDVANALERWVRSLGVEILLNSRVKSIEANETVKGVRTDRGLISSDAVILATGGITYPKTGSTGDGYRMAAELGHHIVEPRPSLTAMVCQELWVRELQGLSLKNVEARLYLTDESGKKKAIGKQFGEMLFTHFGVSGPIILTLSRKAVDVFGKGKIELEINLKPALSEEQLHARLIRDFTSTKHFKNYLPDLLPRAMIPIFIKLTGIPEHLPVNNITAEKRKRMVELLRNLRLTVTGLRPPDEAIVTAGGVDIKEINPKTMESRLVKGLYFVGEVIDIDATTGGYNLQAAFSTGWVAGESAAECGMKGKFRVASDE
ncbi:MAG TPA: NAD(P)/FAD-dependent oxidoreductase [Armatimonadota bacterium]|nr:NAD(P)/FAD-dependent oxidoreductase [Armatimonadota bacterium]HPP75566.1 NAD(P)/FAD-dependent oxidoreductase [Armatimonadota bacterium]